MHSAISHLIQMKSFDPIIYVFYKVTCLHLPNLCLQEPSTCGFINCELRVVGFNFKTIYLRVTSSFLGVAK